MCIPIELDVPVVTADQCEIGVAREIICPCPGDPPVERTVGAGSLDTPSGDLWLRATRPGRPDLYIPFAEIAEAWAECVRLRLDADEVERAGWERIPPGITPPARVGASVA